MIRKTSDQQLDRPVWEDLRFPVTAVNPAGQPSDPDIDTTNGSLLFAASGTEIVFISAQMSHAWAEGTVLKPHVHWQKTTSAAGNVLWELAYKWSSIGAVMDAAFTTVEASTTVGGTPDNDTADEHLITSFGELDATGREISDMLICRVSRLGDDAADTYGADARLLEFDIHFMRDALGTTEEFSA